MKKIRVFGLSLLVWVFSALTVLGQSKPISQLDSVTTVGNADVLPIVNGGQTKKISFGFLYNRINNRLGLATVAKTGSYTDLSNTPTTPINNNIIPSWNPFGSPPQFVNTTLSYNGGILSSSGQFQTNSLYVFNDTEISSGNLILSGSNVSSGIKMNGWASQTYANGIKMFNENILNVRRDNTTFGIPTEHNGVPTTLAVYNAIGNVGNGLSYVSGQTRLGGTLLTGNTDLIPVAGTALRYRNVANTADLYNFGISTFTIGSAGNTVSPTITGNLNITGTSTFAGNTNVSSGTFRVQAISTANALIRNNSGGTAFQASSITENGTTVSLAPNFNVTSATGTTVLGGTSSLTVPTLITNNANLAQTSTATAAGTTTLTVSSNNQQVFTGTTTQTVVLPVATTLTNGFEFRITNQSTGIVTVQSSGLNTIQAMAANTSLRLVCVNTAGGTGTASWTWDYSPINSGLPLTNTLTSGNILVGNVSNIATPVAMSGEATISNTGAVTLGTTAVTGKVLTGLATGNNTAITSGQSILQALQDLQAQINNSPLTVLEGAGNNYPVPTFTANRPIFFLGSDHPQSAIATQMRTFDRWFLTVPNAPTGVAISNIANTSATVAWVAPTNRNGDLSVSTTPNLNYRVQYKTSASGTWLTWGDVPTSPVVITGLVQNTQYDVRIYAFFDFDLAKNLSDPTAVSQFTTTNVNTRWNQINAFAGATQTFRQNTPTTGFSVNNGNSRTAREFTFGSPLNINGTSGVDWTLIFDVQAPSKANDIGVMVMKDDANGNQFNLNFWWAVHSSTNQLKFELFNSSNTQILSTAAQGTTLDNVRRMITVKKRGNTVTVFNAGISGGSSYSNTMNTDVVNINQIQFGHRTYSGTTTTNSFGGIIFGMAAFLGGTQPTDPQLQAWYDAVPD